VPGRTLTLGKFWAKDWDHRQTPVRMIGPVAESRKRFRRNLRGLAGCSCVVPSKRLSSLRYIADREW